MKHLIIPLMISLVSGLFSWTTRAEEFLVKQISFLNISSAITPGTYDYLKQNFSRIPEKSLVVIRINTPGGLVTTTKDIITLIGQSDTPVAIWITPQGASASSAGAIIASAAHFILMSPGTNMGAATPVGLGDDIKESDGRKKALSDLTATVRSLSESRGRPSAPFEKMITDATSFTDQEALKAGIIDGVASSTSEISKIVAGKSFKIKGKSWTLAFSPELTTQEFTPTLGQQILDVLANPSTAYLLFLVGVALIYFEFQAPGGFIAGAVGIAFLVMAAISFQVLPLNWGAMGLLILGIFFFILEIFVTSYGVLSLAGLASFVMGSLFLFHGEGGFISINYPVLLSTLAGVFAGVAFIVWYLVRDARKQRTDTHFFLPSGASGTVLTKYSKGSLYQIKVKGEIWKATSDQPLEPGDSVRVVEVDKEQLLVKIIKSTTQGAS